MSDTFNHKGRVYGTEPEAPRSSCSGCAFDTGPLSLDCHEVAGPNKCGTKAVIFVDIGAVPEQLCPYCGGKNGEHHADCASHGVNRTTIVPLQPTSLPMVGVVDGDVVSVPFQAKPRQMLLATDPAVRKGTPITSGVLDYFPLALAEVARVSKAGNDQHNPGQPLHWSKDKSTDHADCISRHLIDRGTFDPTDNPPQRHSAKLAWRALALLQIELEAEAR